MCAQDSQWCTPLMLAIKHADNAEIIGKLLIDAGCNVNLMDYQKQTALHLAVAREGLLPSLLIKAGASVHSVDNNGNTALHIAAQVQEHYILITILLH